MQALWLGVVAMAATTLLLGVGVLWLVAQVRINRDALLLQMQFNNQLSRELEIMRQCVEQQKQGTEKLLRIAMGVYDD